MAMRRQRTRFTYEDYLNTPDDVRYELLDGELVMAPSPSMRHQRIAGRMFVALQPYVERMELGQAYIAPVDVVLWDGDKADVMQPDLLFVSAARAGIVTEANVQGAPDLVIEILSPSTESRDRGYKRRRYARHGVREYWLVDPDAKSVEVLLLGENDYEVAGTYGPGQTLASPTMAGLAIEVGEVFP